jgi:hypothetical protein
MNGKVQRAKSKGQSKFEGEMTKSDWELSTFLFTSPFLLGTYPFALRGAS